MTGTEEPILTWVESIVATCPLTDDMADEERIAIIAVLTAAREAAEVAFRVETARVAAEAGYSVDELLALAMPPRRLRIVTDDGEPIGEDR